MTITKQVIESIKVLYQGPNGLWGIPYDLRPQQAPRDIWYGRLIPDTLKRAAGYHGAMLSAPGPSEGWVWLGSPGWYGSMNKEEQALVKEFLAPIRLAGWYPGGPNEWVKRSDWETDCDQRRAEREAG